MGALDVLTRKSGVIVGDDVLNVSLSPTMASFMPHFCHYLDFQLNCIKQLFKYAKENKFAIPAIVSPYPIIVPFLIGSLASSHEETHRTSHLLRPLLLLSKLPVMRSPPSLSRCPKEGLPTSPERVSQTPTNLRPSRVLSQPLTTFVPLLPPTGSPWFSTPTTARRSSSHGWTACLMLMRSTLLSTASLFSLLT